MAGFASFGGEHLVVKMAASDAALSGSGSDPVCAHARWCRGGANMAAPIKHQRGREITVRMRR